jgi:hypothetical protein
MSFLDFKGECTKFRRTDVGTTEEITYVAEVQSLINEPPSQVGINRPLDTNLTGGSPWLTTRVKDGLPQVHLLLANNVGATS